jgi:hypothetical protein
MARETKAERTSRLVQETVARTEAERAAYPKRMMTAMNRAINEFNFDLTVNMVDEFVLTDPDKPFSSWSRPDTYALSYSWTENAQEQLEQLESIIERKARERAEAERRAIAKVAALNKLTQEERELLGL